ncbi:MAG TPA: hypothetical protein VME19_00785 [Streptosporangiaceae bacterium]|nr:hypothetical protein [Streptosporangiaceae bacterium]
MKVPRGLWPYLAGAAAARAGDEMSGPALLLLGFAVTGRPGTGSGLLAALTIAAAAGGPAFGAVLDRSPRRPWSGWPCPPRCGSRGTARPPVASPSRPRTGRSPRGSR